MDAPCNEPVGGPRPRWTAEDCREAWAKFYVRFAEELKAKGVALWPGRKEKTASRWEGSPTKIDYRKRVGTHILSSLLEDLDC